MGQLKNIFGVIALVQLVFEPGTSLQLDLDKLDATRTTKIVELRDLVVNSNLAVKDYMKEDYQLAKWLAFKDFDVGATLRAIEENLAWREKEKIDTILTEDWDDLRKRFPYTIDSFDKEGRPVVYINLSEWDLAGYLAEKGEEGAKRYFRYSAMYSEEAENRVRMLRAQGKNVTQFSILSSLAGYNIAKHACIQCLWMYRDVSNILAPYYLPSVDKITVVNSPLLFKNVLSVFSSLVQNNFVFYGQDRKQWEPMLLEIMDKDQIPSELFQEVNPQDVDNLEGWLPWKFEL